MAPISNHQTYCAAMAASLNQKLFWRYLIPDLAVLLDYGCADGALVKQLRQQEDAPFTKVICFDTDEQMLAKCPDEHNIFKFSQEWQALNKLLLLTRPDQPSGVLFSSVLHEVYSHRPPEEIERFWATLADTDVEYIIIRDMYWGDQGWEAMGNKDAVQKLIHMVEKGNVPRAHQFAKEWGHPVFRKNFTHLALKAPYLENWARELKEDYFSVPDLRPMLAELGYEVQLFDHHQVDYIQERIKADTDIDLPFNTHLKAIFRKVK